MSTDWLMLVLTTLLAGGVTIVININSPRNREGRNGMAKPTRKLRK